MGTRGPAPKRESQRRRRNQPERPIDQVDGAVPAPPLGLDDPHPLAEAMYEALCSSLEAGYMTAASWQRARLSAHVMSQQLRRSEGPTAVMYTALQQDWKALLIDPAEQRRLGIEVARAPEVDEDELAAVSALDDFRRTS